MNKAVAAGQASLLNSLEPLSDEDFAQIRTLVKATTGISLGENKRDLVINRLAQRVRGLQMRSYSQYVQYLETDAGRPEMVNMINRITTNKTDFFREKHHFDYLRATVLPQLEKQDRGAIRLWSAGCSSGQEPYSLAITLREYFMSKGKWQLKILATDLDTNILQKAAEGVYDAEQLAAVPLSSLPRYFRKLADGRYAVKPILQQMVVFRKFNLMTPQYKIKMPLDIIFCRNVMIYFDEQAKKEMISKFAGLLQPKGYLFIGHSESTAMSKDEFVNVGPTIYRKV
jgi:chemotaxis protein methyltransferase CheR